MDHLRELARRRRERLVWLTTTTGNVSKDEFDALDRLEKLAVSHHARRAWWVPALAFLTPLLIVTFLYKTEPPETQIDLDATVTAFRAAFPNRQPLFDNTLLKAFDAAGLAGVDNLSAGHGNCSVAVRLDAKSASNDAITLQSFRIPRNWSIRLEQSDKSLDLTLSADPAAMSGAAPEEIAAVVSLAGRASLQTRCGGVTNLRKFTPEELSPLNLRFRSGVTLHLTPLDGQSLKFARHIAFENLALTQEEVVYTDAPSVRQISSVLSGSLFLNALNDRKILLRPSEPLSFSHSSGTLRSIAPSATGLQLQLFATVRGMTTGEPPNQRSLMPTRLQWLGAHRELWLWWGSAVSVFTVLMSVLRWLKIAA